MNKKNTAITLSVVSSIILASIGFEIVDNYTNYTDRDSAREKNHFSRRQMRISSDFDEIIAFAENNAHQTEETSTNLKYLNDKKQQTAKKIEELTLELNETKARLQDLKTNIVIRGGEKEQEYQNKISNLENQLKEAEQESINLKSSLVEREALIENKREELENLSKIFTQTHSALEKNLEEAETRIKKEQEQIDLFILQMQDKLSSNAQDNIKFDNLEQLLNKINEHIVGLQSQVAEATQNAEIEKSRSEELQKALDEMQKHFESSQNKINSLEEQYQNADKKNQELHSHLERSQQSTTKAANEFAELKKLKTQLAEQESHAKNLERQLSLVSGYFKIEQQRASELEESLKKCQNSNVTNNDAEYTQNEISDLEDKLRAAEEKNRKLLELFEQGQPNSGAHFKQCAILSSQQEKLIQDLQKNLSIVERRNKDLEQQISKIKGGQSSTGGSSSSDEAAVHDLKMRLKQYEDRIEQLKAQLAASSTRNLGQQSKNLNQEQDEYPSESKSNDDDSQKIIKQLKTNQDELYNQIMQLKKALAETKAQNHEQPQKNATPQPATPPKNRDLVEKFDDYFKDEDKKQNQSTSSKVSSGFQSTSKFVAIAEDPVNTESTVPPSTKVTTTRSPLTDKEKEAVKKLQEKQDRVASLEKRLQKLQESLALQSGNEEEDSHEANSSKEIFKAKIAYLTTRLTQEKMKLTRAQHDLDSSQ